MKTLLILLAISTIASTNVYAGVSKAESQLISSATGAAAADILLSVYVPALAVTAVAGTGASATSIWAIANIDGKAMVQKAVNRDAQEFALNGLMPESLSQSIQLLKEQNAELSDAEALDILISSVNE